MNLIMAFFIFLVGFNSSAQVSAREPKLSPFQKNIQACLKDRVDVSQVKNLQELYQSLDKSFPLRRTETLYREVVFKDKAETKKLKLEKGKISLFKVLPDKTVVLLNNDARQKGLTEDSAMNQLLVRVDIESDWRKVSESRAEGFTLIWSQRENQITQLSFQKTGAAQKLECTNRDSSDICLCRP